MSDYWTFSGISFLREVSGDEPQWFPEEEQRSVDVIAGTGTRIVDVGAIMTEPLSFTALCASSTVAANLYAARRTDATLTSPMAWSRSARLVRAVPLVNDGAFYRIALTFEALS